MKRMMFLAVGVVLLAWWGFRVYGGEEQPKQEVPVEIPEKLRIPEGNSKRLTFEAEGVQIYISKKGKDGKPEWSFKGPLAELFDKGKKVGYHYAGPSGPCWEMLDGSKAARNGKVESTPAPNEKESIDWLRIQVKADDEKGTTLRQVTYILRVNTRGGLPPTEPPSRVGTEVGVKYRATYQFYGPAK